MGSCQFGVEKILRSNLCSNQREARLLQNLGRKVENLRCLFQPIFFLDSIKCPVSIHHGDFYGKPYPSGSCREAYRVVSHRQRHLPTLNPMVGDDEA